MTTSLPGAVDTFPALTPGLTGTFQDEVGKENSRLQNKQSNAIAALEAMMLARVFLCVGNNATAAIKAGADAVGDGTGTGDLAALNAAKAVAGIRPIVLVGDFRPSAAVSISAKDDIDIRGIGCRIFTVDSTFATPSFNITGSRTAVTYVGLTSTSLDQGKNTISATSFTGVSAGDWVAVTIQDLGWSTRPGENFAGEMMQVESNVGGVLTFKTPFRFTYALASPTTSLAIYRYNFIQRCRVDGVQVIGPGGTGHTSGTGTNRERMFAVQYAIDPEITNCYVEGPYGREGIAVYECLRPHVHNIGYKDVNDLAGSSGNYEAYAVRVQGCEGALIENIHGSGSRHAVEVNGGQSSYGLTGSQTRPLSFNTIVRHVDVVKSWGAAVGDHPGAVSTTFEDIYANGSSGAVFVRGLTARIQNVTYRGGTHEQGPYASNQGNDHCITLGEQQRLANGSSDTTGTFPGGCGTDVVISGILHDMTGNGTPLGSTSHTIHAVHPLVRARIFLGEGTTRPTGNAVNAIGMFNEDVEITGVADLTAAFGGNGRYAYLVPAACVPSVSTGQYNRDIRIDGTAIKPRSIPVLIAGSADTTSANRSDRIDVRLKVKTLGSGMTSSSAIVSFGANPNGTTGFFGYVAVRDLEGTAVAFATAVDTSSASVRNLEWFGVSRFSDGAKIDGVPWLASGMNRIPETTGEGTVTPVVGDANVLYLWKVRGCGQPLTAVCLGLTAVGSNDGTLFGFRVGAYADDGTGTKPILGAAPLFDSGLIAPGGATGNVTSAITFTEPIGEYWVGIVMQSTGGAPPATYPTLVSLANPKLMPPIGLISTGTTVNQARVWKQTAVAGNLSTLTAPTQDQSAHVLAGLQR